VLDFHVRIVSLIRHLEPGPEQQQQLFAEILLWPEITTFGNRLKTILRDHLKLVEQLVQSGDPAEIHERQVPSIPEEGSVNLRILPLQPSTAWSDPVDLSFPLVIWSHDGYRIAYIPDLELEVVAEPETDLMSRVEEDVRTALMRCGHAKDLLSLALLQRTRKLELGNSLLNLFPETPRERFDRSETDAESGSELSKVGVLLEPERMPVAWCREGLVQDLATTLTGRRATSVLLVGLPGVGKTAIFQELVRRREELGLEGRPFWKTSGARLVSGMSGFGDWQERCQKIAKEAKGSQAILHFGNLEELLESGRAEGKSDNVAAFFRPKMVRGELLAVIECTPDQLSAVEKQDPRVLDGLRQFRVEEPSPEISRRILREVAADILRQEPDEAALQRVDTLHRRYAGYSAYPGKPVRFLKQLLRSTAGKTAPDGAPLSVVRVNEVFSAETGLPLALLEDSIPLDLAQTETWLRERVMGQDGAVQVVVDTIATIKARLSRPGKPLASLLFVGPTGVGKTELAKTLAEFFYGSRERMIRLDMSEYNTSLSATRLVSDAGKEREGILTAQMRDQPFSLVLLDEFEKAHPAVFDLFLQVLGEARLTDGAGRVADFSNAVVIMTSNLGAQEYRAGVRLGFGGGVPSESGAAEHFIGEAKKRFRPEFFNRIDHIVPFAPLNPEHLRRIVAKELESLRRRDGIRGRHLRLELEPELIDRILERGYDPRYGARPLRRQIGVEVLRRVAENLNESSRERGEVRIGLSDIRYTKAPGPSLGAPLSELEVVADLRRKFQRLTRGSFVGELTSEKFRLDRALRLAKRTKIKPEEVKASFGRLQRIDGLLKLLEKKANAVTLREETLLLEQNGFEAADGRKLGMTTAEYENLMLELYAAAERAPEMLVLVFQADELSHLFSLVDDYHAVAGRLGCSCRLGVYPRKPAKKQLDEVGGRVCPQAVEPGFLESRDEETLALALEIRGPLAHLWFRGEIGGHEFEMEERGGKKKYRLLVHSLEGPLEAAWMDREKLRQGMIRGLSVHRRYNLLRGSWKDDLMGVSGHDFYDDALLERIVHQRLITEAERVL
jgi:ATP-dependent Clp protease ATP-binding subunit ClpC